VDAFWNALRPNWGVATTPIGQDDLSLKVSGVAATVSLLARLPGYASERSHTRPFKSSKSRDRLPLPLHKQVFALVLRLVDRQQLISGKTVGVDSTTLVTNAAI
jgi:hypothetical protein